jgi:hypothetical protein
VDSVASDPFADYNCIKARALEIEKLKELVIQEIDAHRQELIDLSLRIHSNPELGFEERRASAWLTDYLEGKGFVSYLRLSGQATARGSRLSLFSLNMMPCPRLGMAVATI